MPALVSGRVSADIQALAGSRKFKLCTPGRVPPPSPCHASGIRKVNLISAPALAQWPSTISAR